MRLFRHISDIPAAARGSVVALGNFDGLHRGHQAVLGTAGAEARAMGVPLSVVITEPHPVRFFKPDVPPFRLTPPRERLALLDHFGVDQVLVLPFDAALAGMKAQDFVADILLGGLGAYGVVVGYDYRFGNKRGGGSDVLAWMGAMEGFSLHVVSPVRDATKPEAAGDQAVFSSTRIRDAIRAGDVRLAADMLGHWWGVNARVIRGDQRGRTIGFPTANMELGDCVQPALGVYAVRARVDDEDTVYDGVANLGRRPTFDKQDIRLEVHLFDCARDLYDRHLRVELVDFIRPEQKFDGLDALKAQIATDCDSARALLKQPENARSLLPRPTLDRWLAEVAQ